MQNDQAAVVFGIGRNPTAIWSVWDLAESNYESERETLIAACAFETVMQLFEAQTRATPDLAAVVYRDRKWTYNESNQSANQEAHHLRCLGVAADAPVGVCLDRSLEMTATVLGVLRAGGAYVPLIPTYPDPRLAYIVTNSQLQVALTRSELHDRLPSVPGRFVSLDIDADQLPDFLSDDPTSPASGLTAKRGVRTRFCPAVNTQVFQMVHTPTGIQTAN